jgi:hypothetical protein
MGTKIITTATVWVQQTPAKSQAITYSSHALRGSFPDRSRGLFLDAGASKRVPTQSVGTIKSDKQEINELQQNVAVVLFVNSYQDPIG